MPASPESSTATEIHTIVCPKCRTELHTGDQRCSKCGASTTGFTPLLDRPWFILGLLFLAAMVLGLPFLWTSRAFQPKTKVVIAILVVVETVVVFWAFALTMMWCYRTIMDSLH